MDPLGAPSRKVLRVGVLTPATQMDSLDSLDFVSGMVLWQIFERPFAIPEGNRAPRPVLFEGNLVEERASGGGGAVYTGQVRSDVRFSDGVTLTAEHVAAALDAAEWFGDPVRVTAEGARVRFELERAVPRFERLLTQGFAGIARRVGGRLVGTGPYMLAPGGKPEDLRVVRNPHYREKVPIDEIHFKVYPKAPEEPANRLVRAIDAGEVDYTNVLSRDDVSRLKTVRKAFQPGTSTGYLYFNTERPFLREPAVRSAIAQGINRGEIAATCYANALAFTAQSLLPPAMDSSDDRIRFSLEQARRALEATGQEPPARLELLVIWGPRPYLPQPIPVAETIQTQLGKLGIRVDIQRSRDDVDFYRRVERGSYDMVLSGWIADTPDVADFLDVLLSSKLVPTPEKSLFVRANLARWRSDEMDEALRAHRDDPSLANRRRVLSLVAREAPLFPLMYGPSIVVSSRRVRPFTPSPVGIPNFAELDLED